MSKHTKEELLKSLKRLNVAAGLAKLTRNEHIALQQDVEKLTEHLDCNCHEKKTLIEQALEGPTNGH